MYKYIISYLNNIVYKMYTLYYGVYRVYMYLG